MLTSLGGSLEVLDGSLFEKEQGGHTCTGEDIPGQSPSCDRVIGGKKPPWQHAVSPTDDDVIDSGGVDAGREY